MSDQLPGGGTELSPEEIEALDARWSSSWTPDEVAHRLAGISTPWCVAAGWALDLFRGRQTRDHGDIEIAIPEAGFPEVRDRFPGYVFDAAGSGRIWEDAPPETLAAVHQTWLRDPATGNYLLDVFREPHDGDTWISPARRDDPAALQRDRPPHPGRHPVSGTRTGAPVQGEARAPEGPEGLRRDRPAPDRGPARDPGGAAGPRPPGACLAHGSVAGATGTTARGGSQVVARVVNGGALFADGGARRNGAIA